ncbi:restriction endonuclease [Angustibacter aerolatus]
MSDVRLQGRGTKNQIDVIWEGYIDGELQRVLFECKHYKRKVDQGKLHAFRSVLDDIQDAVPTYGVFVTTVGYQSGASSLAETYGLTVLELREPARQDLEGRVTRIDLTVNMRMEVMEELQLEPSEPINPSEMSIEPDEASIHFPDGSVRSLRDVMTRDERSPLDQPATPPHRVQRNMEPGTVLHYGEVRIPIKALRGVVGDSDSRSMSTIGPGTEGIAHILRDAITGATVWFEKDGHVRVLDSPNAAS